MLIKSYFKTQVSLKRLLSTENDMLMPEYGEEEKIMVRVDGTAGFKYSNSKIINSTDYVYLTADDIPLGSLLNEMPVKSVEIIYEFNGRISHYEVIAGPTG